MLAYDTPFYSVNEGFLSSTASSLVEKIDRYLPSATMATATATAATAMEGKSTTRSLRLTGSPQTATKSVATASKSSSNWGLFAGAVGAIGVAAVGAYMARDKISSTASDAYDHLEFVSALMDRGRCHKR